MPKKNPKKPEPVDPFQQTLVDMHVGLADALLKRIRSGEATAADLNVARQFLKDNGIEGNPKVNAPLRDLAETLPFAVEA